MQKDGQLHIFKIPSKRHLQSKCCFNEAVDNSSNYKPKKSKYLP